MNTSTEDDGKRLKRAIILTVYSALFVIGVQIASAGSVIHYEKQQEIVPPMSWPILIEVVKAEEPEPEPVVIASDTFLHYASYCESRHRQYNNDGSVLRGRVDSRDVGRWQINEYYWLEKSIELGIDIYTESGNHEMARYILNVAQGESAWAPSAECIRKNFGYVIS